MEKGREMSDRGQESTTADSATGAVVWFSEEACKDVTVAGGKGASLAKMAAEGLPVPPGFVIPAHILEESVDTARLGELVLAQDHDGLRTFWSEAKPPREEISAAYERLTGGRITATYKRLGSSRVAVRSSACAEDSEAASYAGQQETYLNIEGAEEVCAHVVECWASFFSEQAMFYREQKGSLEDLGMAVVVQKMVDPDKSGVLFTVDPVRRRKDRMVVEAVFGLGEQVVSGEVTPDHYVLDKKGNVKREKILGDERILNPDELLRLAELGHQLEEKYSVPQDIEWAIVGEEVYLLQSRPVTTL
jgi:pyruvate,water dikinase